MNGSMDIGGQLTHAASPANLVVVAPQIGFIIHRNGLAVEHIACAGKRSSVVPCANNLSASYQTENHRVIAKSSQRLQMLTKLITKYSCNDGTDEGNSCLGVSHTNWNSIGL